MKTGMVVVTVLFPIFYQITAAATLPAGFTEQIVASSLSSPTAMEIAPDGRVFVCEQGGTLRIIKNNSLLPTPFLSLTVDNSGERGLLGVTFDPNFASNGFVYVYYTATTPNSHNRVSRFTASGDIVVPGSEVVLLNLDPLGATIHNGGSMHFGNDGKLYIAVGENSVATNSQSMTTLLGKMLRMNSDGSIPTDNPFYGTASGQYRLIWALGLRNPFTFAFQQTTGKMFINDVGQSTWEEIDYGKAGANYGWPVTEGIANNPLYVDPMFEYGHTGSVDLTGCAITGGAFYNPSSVQFPGGYVGKYFFADYCSGWIRLFNPADSTASSFVSGISSPVDLKVSQDGGLYYLARGGGASTGIVSKIIYTASLAPLVTSEPGDIVVPQGASATFSVTASGNPPLSYQWQRNGANIGSATSASYTIGFAQPADNGAGFRCIVSNPYGSDTSRSAILTVTPDRPPVATITQPVKGSLYSAGDTIYYRGTGTDPEQGTLPGGAFTWTVDFQHNTHHHPFIPPTSGATGGSFVIPTIGETSDTVWYRIYLTVTDSQGLSSTDTAEIFPRKSTVTLNTVPPGLQLLLDGVAHTSPYSFVGVVGIQRNIAAVTPQVSGGITYSFGSWSGGQPASFTLMTPLSNTTYTATYAASPAAPVLVSPPDGAANQPVALTLSWNASSGAASYRVQLSTSSSFASTIIDDSSVVSTSRVVSGLANSTLYYWRVNAKNAAGTSPWSTVNRLTTIALPDTTAPVVTMTSPTAGGTLSGTAALSANASDNIAVTRVDFYLGATLLASDSSAPYSISWNSSTVANGSYAFSARGYDAAGNVGISGSVNATVSNSSADLFVYQDRVLNTPWTDKSWGGTVNVLTSTDHIYQGTTSMKVTQGHWGAASFLNGEWGSVQNFDASLYQSIDFVIYAPSPLINLSVGLINGNTYRAGPEPANQWITVSIPMSALYTTSSLFSQFYITDQNDNSSTVYYLDNIRLVSKMQQAQPPQAPVLVSPSNGAANQPVALTLSWNASSGAASYRVQLSDTSSFGTLIVNDSTLTGTSRPVSGLLNGKTYYWRVNAKNATGTSAYSTVYSFRTIDAIPQPPVLVSPSNGAANQPVALTLSWNASSGAVSYRVQLSDTTSFGTLIVDDSSLTGTSRPVSGLLNGKTYYWRVNAKNAGGTSSFSAVNSFRTIDAVPPPPVLVSPANGAANQPVALTLLWNASSGAASYRVQLSDTSSFGTLIVDDSSLSGTSRPVSGLLNGKTYYWRVNAKNAGGTSSFSAVNNFRTIDAVPTPPVLVSPPDGAANQPVALTLSWNASSGAASYRVQLSTSSSFASTFIDDSSVVSTTRIVSGLANSTLYYWRVNAKNAAGTSPWSTVNRLTTIALPDTTAPVVTMTSPTAGGTLSGTAALSANASDNIAVTRVDFYLGATLLASDSSAPYSISWNSSTVANGSYAFSARGYDAAGNVGISGSVNATVSNSSADLFVYQDRVLNTPWTDKSWGGTVNVLTSTDHIYQGTTSMKVTQGHWGAASFLNGEWGSVQNFDASLYQSIDFVIYAPSPLINLSVGLINGNTYRAGPEPANQWITVSIPMSALYTTSSLFSQFYITDQNDNSSTVYYLDNIRLVRRGSTTTPGIRTDPSASLLLDNNGAPDHFELSQNYPNPFNPATRLSFSLPEASHVTLTLFNSIGEKVSTLLDDQWVERGVYQLTFNASGLASGTYFYMINSHDGAGGAASNHVSVKRMLYIK